MDVWIIWMWRFFFIYRWFTCFARWKRGMTMRMLDTACFHRLRSIYMYIVHGGLILYVENSCSATNMTPRSLVLRGFSWLHTKHLCVERPISSSCVGSDFTNPDFLLFCIYPPHPPAHHLVGYPKKTYARMYLARLLSLRSGCWSERKKQTHSTMLLLWGWAVVWWVVYTWYPTLYIDWWARRL